MRDDVIKMCLKLSNGIILITYNVNKDCSTNGSIQMLIDPNNFISLNTKITSMRTMFISSFSTVFLFKKIFLL